MIKAHFDGTESHKVACIAALNLLETGKNVLFCIGKSTQDSKEPFNFLLVSDPNSTLEPVVDNGDDPDDDWSHDDEGSDDHGSDDDQGSDDQGSDDQGSDDSCDDGSLIRWYWDADHDGYGSGSSFTEACELPEVGYVDIAGDCDDEDPNNNPDDTMTCTGQGQIIHTVD